MWRPIQDAYVRIWGTWAVGSATRGRRSIRRSPIDTEVAERYGQRRSARALVSRAHCAYCIDVEVLAAHGDAQKYCECPIHCICRCALSQAEYAEPEASTPPV